jgi:acetyl esterase
MPRVTHTLSLLAALALSASAADQPSSDGAAAMAAPIAHTYREVEGRKLNAFVFARAEPSSSPSPAVVLAVGGAWTRGTPEQLFFLARFFASQGIVAVPVEYRLADRSNSPVESYDDLCNAIAFLRRNAKQFAIDPHRIAAWGNSSSGQVVAVTATVGCGNSEGSLANGGPDALLLVSPVVDAAADGLFRQLMRGYGDPASLSPVHTLRGRIAPTIITQGEADETTTLARSQVFCTRVTTEGGNCELLSLPGIGHVLDASSRKRSAEEQVRFLRQLWPRAGG